MSQASISLGDGVSPAVGSVLVIETATGIGGVVESGVANGGGNQTDVVQTSGAHRAGSWRWKILGVVFCVGHAVVIMSS